MRKKHSRSANVGSGTEGAPPRAHWLTLGILAAGLGMIVLDGTIVGVALPDIIRDLGMTLTNAEWVNSLYAVVVGALLLATGNLADRWGRRNLFLVGMIIFVAGSIFAGFTRTSGLLLAARAVQAVGAAAIMPSTLSTVNALFRGRYRAMAFGIWGAVISGAAAIGPLAGGALTQWASWRWIFFVNIPIGALLLVGTVLWVPETRGGPQKSFDYLGFVLSSIGLGSLVFAIIEGPRAGWWKPKADFSIFGATWPADAALSIVACAFALAIVTLGTFIWWESHRIGIDRSALLDLRLFHFPTFSWGNLTAAMVAVGEFALLFVLPLYLVNVLGLSVMGAGVILAAMALGAFASGAMARHIAGSLGSPGTVILGLSLEVVGVVALSVITTATIAGWALTIPLAVYGLGLGLASAQLTGTILHDVPVEQSGQGSATQSTVRQVGSALGTAFSGTALSVILAKTLPRALGRAGVPGEEIGKLAEMTRVSAGSNLMALRQQAGPEAEETLNALTQGFSDGVRGSMLTSAAFLLIGLLGSLIVYRAARKEAALDSSPELDRLSPI